MTRCLLLVLVACSTRAVPDVAGVGTAVPVAVETPPLTAAHGAVIEQIAVTDAGDAAVTQDQTGGTRLWSTLDGTREPIVVHIARTLQLAVGHDVRGYVIASLDQGFGLEIVRLSESGGLVSHVSLSPEPAFDSIAITEQGILAARADQTLAFVSDRGEVTMRLEAPAAERIEHVLTRHGRTLVLLTHLNRFGPSMYGRWLDGESWGGVMPDLQVDPKSIAALSPNGKRLLVDFAGAPYLLDTETGKIIDNFGASVLVGFTDDEHIATFAASNLVWRLASARFEAHDAEKEISFEPFAVGDGVVLSANRGSLLLHTPQAVRQLGYRVTDPSGVRVAGDRVLGFGMGSELAVFDADLEKREVVKLPDEDRLLVDLIPIDERFAIATYTKSGLSWWTASVLDQERHTTWQSLQPALVRGDIRYEPTTGLLSVTDSVASWLTRWDDKRHSFETWYRIDGKPADVHLVDPQQTGGVVALVARTINGGIFDVEEIHGEDLKVGASIKPRRTHRIEGGLAAVDRLGTVYAVDHDNLVIYRNGLEVTRIAEAGRGAVEPQPGGGAIVVYGDQRIRLYEATGEQRWQIAAPLAQRIAWLGNELVVDYSGGLGKIDAATGALIKRTCGWSFGLGALSTDEVLAGDSICDAN